MNSYSWYTYPCAISFHTDAGLGHVTCCGQWTSATMMQEEDCSMFVLALVEQSTAKPSVYCSCMSEPG